MKKDELKEKEGLIWSLHRQGCSVRRISRETGVSRRNVEMTLDRIEYSSDTIKHVILAAIVIAMLGVLVYAGILFAMR